MFKEFDKGKLPWHMVLEKKVAKKTAYKYYYIWALLQNYDYLVNYLHKTSASGNVNKDLILDLLKWGKQLHPSIKAHYKVNVKKMKNNRAWLQSVICHICKQIQIMACSGEVTKKMFEDFSKILEKYKIDKKRISLIESK